MPDAPPIAAILVGGKSRRFGRDKTSIIIGDETLLERTVRVVQKALGEPPLLVGATLPDDRAGNGPLAGIETALRLADGRAVVVVAADLAGLSSRLVAYLAGHPSGASLVIPEVAGRQQPLCARWAPSALETVSARLDEGRRAVMAAVDAVDRAIVTEEELERAGCRPSWELQNINTQDDLARFLERT